MPLEILTLQDLLQFKCSLVEEIKNILGRQEQKELKTLKSTEVCKMLRITPATLQNMRRNKIINASKIGGTFYYLYEDIIQLLPGKKK
jgi:hypothetical protein